MSYQDKAEQMYKILYEEENKDERARKFRELIKDNNLQDRVNIKAYYNTVYAKKNLYDDIEEQLSGNFKDLCKSLFMDPLELDCFEINEALNSFTYDKNNLFEFITARPYRYRQKIKEKYFQLYGKNLEREIASKFSSDITANILNTLNTERPRGSVPTPDKIKEKAQTLANSKEKDWVQNLAIFGDTFTNASPEELVYIGRTYYDLTGKDFVEQLKHPLLKEIVYNACKPSELYARKLHDALKGFFTDSNTVNRIVASRNEVDMDKIKQMYYYLYHSPLAADILEETSGPYKDLLIDFTADPVDA